MNIGFNGIITNKNSLTFINKIHKFGDVLQFSVKKYDSLKKCFVLDFIKKENMLYNNINYYSSQNIINNNHNLLYIQNQNNQNQQQEFYLNYSQHVQQNLIPKNYSYYNSNPYKFIIPIQYSPVNYLMSDSIYSNSYNLQHFHNSPHNSQSLNKKNLTSTNTRLNINNVTRFKMPSMTSNKNVN